MQTAGFTSEYILLDFSRKKMPKSLQRFDDEAFFASFDSVVIFYLKSCLHFNFDIKL